MSADCDKIIVHLIEGFRTVIVDHTVKFRSVIDSITERLSSQYAKKHNAPAGENKYSWIFGIRYTKIPQNGERPLHIWLHPEMTHGEYLQKIQPGPTGETQRLELRVRYFPSDYGPQIY